MKNMLKILIYSILGREWSLFKVSGYDIYLYLINNLKKSIQKKG